MKRTRNNIQRLTVKALLQPLFACQSIAQKRVDSSHSELTQSEPKLEDFCWPASLQSDLTTMGTNGGRLHVRKSGSERSVKGGLIANQQQGGRFGDPEQFLGIHGD